jgi:hypothetical protein
MTRRPRNGFALLAVLWIMTGIAVLGLGLSLVARGAIATARNRMELTRASWRAEDCVERARAVIARVLQPQAGEGAPAYAPALDSAIASASLVSECPGLVTLEPVGIALDLNEATDETLRRLLLRQGISLPRTDSLVDAVLDWRDGDDVQRPSGAEREWYERQGRSPPRNARFAHVDELRRVRGFDSWSSASWPSPDSLAWLFTVERGGIVLERAPAAVLAALPGITGETIARIAERRLRGAPPLSELLALGGELSVASRDSLHRHYSELVQLVTIEPDAWILTARSRGSVDIDASGGALATIELRLVRAGARAAIVRRRAWP